MNTHFFAPGIFGLVASLYWGSGDFSGGLASRRAYAGSVVLTDYAVGLVLLVTLALIGKEPIPDPADLLWGGLARVAGVLGLLSFYAALSRAKMGIVAPVSALGSAFPFFLHRKEEPLRMIKRAEFARFCRLMELIHVCR